MIVIPTSKDQNCAPKIPEINQPAIPSTSSIRAWSRNSQAFRFGAMVGPQRQGDARVVPGPNFLVCNNGFFSKYFFGWLGWFKKHIKVGTGFSVLELRSQVLRPNHSQPSKLAWQSAKVLQTLPPPAIAKPDFQNKSAML